MKLWLKVSSTVSQAQTDVPAETDPAPIPSNTPFVSAENSRLRDEARKEAGDLEITEPDEEVEPVITDYDSPEWTGPTEPEPTSNEEMFEEKEEVKLTPVKDKFRMGPYDGLCVSSDKYLDNSILSNEDIITYFGVKVPAEIVSSQDVLTVQTVDGTKDTPQKLTMFANNKASINCCGESPFMTSMGCVCLTENQREFIRSRGLNTGDSDI